MKGNPKVVLNLIFNAVDAMPRFAEMIAEEDYHKARIDDVISKPYALSDVLFRANTLLARHAADHRETMTV